MTTVHCRFVITCRCAEWEISGTGGRFGAEGGSVAFCGGVIEMIGGSGVKGKDVGGLLRAPIDFSY